MKEIQRRWSASDPKIVPEIYRFLEGDRPDMPDGVGRIDGRWDLRGMSVAQIEDRVSHALNRRIRDMKEVNWVSLDLRWSDLADLRFFDAFLSNCLFDGAICRNWRLWSSEVEECSFEHAVLRESVLGSWHNGRGNSWRKVNFDNSDMRSSLLRGCLIDDCSFRMARLDGSDFEQVALRNSQFSGVLRNVTFDGRALDGRPGPTVIRRVDFSEADFVDVEFRGCEASEVLFPEAVHVIVDFPRKARRMLELMDGDTSLPARMLRAEYEMVLRSSVSEESFSIFNKADYVASGGEELAAYAVRMLQLVGEDV